MFYRVFFSCCSELCAFAWMMKAPAQLLGQSTAVFRSHQQSSSFMINKFHKPSNPRSNHQPSTCHRFFRDDAKTFPARRHEEHYGFFQNNWNIMLPSGKTDSSGQLKSFYLLLQIMLELTLSDNSKVESLV